MNKFKKGAQQLEAAKAHSSDLFILIKNASTVIRTYGDTEMIVQFNMMTNFQLSSDIEFRLKKTNEAIDIMIGEFNSREETDFYGTIAEANPKEYVVFNWLKKNLLFYVIPSLLGLGYTLYQIGFTQGGVSSIIEKNELVKKIDVLETEIETINKAHNELDMAKDIEVQNVWATYNDCRDKYDSIMKKQKRPLYVYRPKKNN